MKITIHRGTNQIGGCVTEYESNGYRLFVDYGEPLQTEQKTNKLLVEGLTHRDTSKSALLITHYHGDHIGKIDELPDNLPIYLGAIGRDIHMTLSKHMLSVDKTKTKVLERLRKANIFEPGKPFRFEPFNIMPIMLDHSAFDGYAFIIEADGVKVFHTGDFRTHGFRSGKLRQLIAKYVGHVDYVVCEATNVDRPDATNLSEHELQSQFEKAFKANKYHIVYLSSTNIDRLFALYHAALKAKRPFYVDGYQKQIMDIVAKQEHLWSKAELYRYDNQFNPIVLRRKGAEFSMNDKFKKFLNTQGYVLIARSNDCFDNFIKHLPGEPKQRYLSMGNGYVNPDYEAYNENLAKALGQDYKYLHTSGHCDMKSLHFLFELLQPKAIIPMHTDNPNAFAEQFSSSHEQKPNLFGLCHGEKTSVDNQQFSASWKVLLPKDGDSIHLNSCHEDSPSI